MSCYANDDTYLLGVIEIQGTLWVYEGFPSMRYVGTKLPFNGAEKSNYEAKTYRGKVVSNGLTTNSDSNSVLDTTRYNNRFLSRDNHTHNTEALSYLPVCRIGYNRCSLLGL